MSDRKAKLNPTLSLALQARSTGQSTSQEQDEHSKPAGNHTASDFRRLARSGKDGFSTGIPTVCTIH